MAEEKELAWMPVTNNVNEGALGAFCIQMQTNPQLTMTNYNALAIGSFTVAIFSYFSATF